MNAQFQITYDTEVKVFSLEACSAGQKDQDQYVVTCLWNRHSSVLRDFVEFYGQNRHRITGVHLEIPALGVSVSYPKAGMARRYDEQVKDNVLDINLVSVERYNRLANWADDYKVTVEVIKYLMEIDKTMTWDVAQVHATKLLSLIR